MIGPLALAPVAESPAPEAPLDVHEAFDARDAKLRRVLKITRDNQPKYRDLQHALEVELGVRAFRAFDLLKTSKEAQGKGDHAIAEGARDRALAAWISKLILHR